MDQELLSGKLDVDEYVHKLIREVDQEKQAEMDASKAAWGETKEEFMERLDAYLQSHRKKQVAKLTFAKWKLHVETARTTRALQEQASSNAELDMVKYQNVTLNRQKKELAHRVTELSESRAHGLDVSDLLSQVRELVQELERVKAENAALVSKSEVNQLLGRRGPLSSSSSAANIVSNKQHEAVGKMVREYQHKVQRLEEDISSEKLKRANETAKRLEKETECGKYRREVEDAKAEVISLQLKLARMEAATTGAVASNSPTSARPPTRQSFILMPSAVPGAASTIQVSANSLDAETWTNTIADYHEVTASDTLTSNAPRKSFFRPSGSSKPLLASQHKQRKPLAALQEENVSSPPANENCAQQ